jgi:nucleotide-binding universal stress UspA family protein
MKNRILLLTDFSDNSLNAITYALDFYQKENCIFYFLNAFWADKKPSDIAMLVPEPDDEEYQIAKKVSKDGLATLIRTIKLRPDNSKHSYETISSYNSLLFALKDIIAKNQINLLFMGTKGDTDEDEILYGSNTLNVMEFITECPILAVPGDYRFTGLNKILFPTDYETVFDEVKLKCLLEIAKYHNSEIKILHIKKERQLDNVQEKNKVLFESVFYGLKFSFPTLENMEIHKGIQSFIETENCDLIVFVDEKSDYFGNELPKPLIKEIESHLTIPVLAINPIK